MTLKGKSIQDFITPVSCVDYDLPNGNRLFVKRDDLLPFSFGGNKVRISECYLRDMREKKKNLMIGYGNNRSNLCRTLSNLCFSNGIPIWIVSPADENGSRSLSFNSALVADVFHAKVIQCSKTDVAATIQNAMNEAERQGYAPYYINGDCFGHGNEAVPVQAYVDVYSEIEAQSVAMNCPFDHIFVTVGTGMTLAGLVCGQKISLRTKSSRSPGITGISIARSRENAMSATNRYISAYFQEPQTQNAYDIFENSGNGYGCYDEKTNLLIEDFLAKTGMPLDPNYTGKGFDGMLKVIKDKQIRESNILFIHTGGLPLFFDHLRERGSK